MRTAVAHGYDKIILLQPYLGTVYLLAADVHLRLGIVAHLFIAYQYTQGIIILYQHGSFIADDVDYRESRICNSPDRTYRQSTRDSRYAVFKRKPCCKHSRDYFRCKGRKYACLYTAAKTVCKNYDRGIIILNDIDMISAQLFTYMIYAFESDIRTQVIHPVSTP